MAAKLFADRQTEIALLYMRGFSIPQIAERLGASRSTIRLRLLDAGVTLRTPADGMTKAKRERRGISPQSGKYERTPEIRAKLSAARLQMPAKGVSHKKNGYVQITRGPNKHRGQHVVLMEEKIGRRITKDECVHHDDHVRSNNSDNNLKLMTRSDHARLHIQERLAAGERIEKHFLCHREVAHGQQTASSPGEM